MDWIGKFFETGSNPLIDPLLPFSITVFFNILILIGVILIAILYNNFVIEEKECCIQRVTLLYLYTSGLGTAVISGSLGTYQLSGYPEWYFYQFDYIIPIRCIISGIMYVFLFLFSRFFILKRS
ncbi:MAG: hypothetical protein ACFFAE_13425 [Candidatus Hodarchaeota archaeon]